MCLKIAYQSRGEATLALRATPGQHVYHCQHCGFWHLSSKSKRQAKLARKS